MCDELCDKNFLIEVQKSSSVTSCNAQKDYLDIAFTVVFSEGSTPLPGLELFGPKSSTSYSGLEPFRCKGSTP